MTDYKYYLSLTSQLPFCSVPMRLDSYNKCQFACTYCFAKARGGSSDSNGIQTLNPNALNKRFRNVNANKISGATEEFLAQRIPMQFGGMTDPFSNLEKSKKITLESLKILADNNYPTILSSKGILAGSDEYLDTLKSGNFYYRISITIVSEVYERQIEKGVPSVSERLELARLLTNAGVPVSLRFQPIFFDCEERAIEIAKMARKSGVKHISLEYLKLPIENNSNEMKYLSSIFPELKERYHALGAKQVGREYVLPAGIKAERLKELKRRIEELGILVGFADNEFLHFNEFKSCCNGADLFLKDAKFFKANILQIIKNQKKSEQVRFELPTDYWIPNYSMFSHLNSNSRPPHNCNNDNKLRWTDYLKAKWNSDLGRGGPLDFYGFIFDGQTDRNGNRIYLNTIPTI